MYIYHDRTCAIANRFRWRVEDMAEVCGNGYRLKLSVIVYAAAASCDCCIADWICIIYHQISLSISWCETWMTIHPSWPSRSYPGCPWSVALSVNCRAYLVSAPITQTVQYICTHISLLMNSRRPLTDMTASVLSCFSSTGPICL